MTLVLLAALTSSVLGGTPDAGALQAEAVPGVEDLEGLLDVNVVSGASREQERSDDAPATITVVTADELRRYGLRSLHEAINFLSLGMVAQDPLHSVEVGSRGVLFTVDYGNHVLVVIDGHVMNEQWNGTAYFEQGLGLPLEAIDHLEFIVGPGSVLYGSSAMLGVINVVTKRARDLGTVQVTLEGSALPAQGVDAAPQLRWPGLGATGRLSLLAGYETTLAGTTLEVSLAAEYFAHHGQSLTYATQEGLTEGDDQRPQLWGPRAPGAGSWGGTTTDAWKTQVPSALLTARFGAFTFWARGALYSRNTPANDQFGLSLDFDDRAREVDRWVNLELRWAKTLSPSVQLMARAYLDLYDYRWNTHSSSWLTFGSDAPLPDGVDPSAFVFDVDLLGGSRWGGLETQATWDLTGDGRFPLMTGVDARLRHFTSLTTRTADDVVLDTTNEYSASEWQVGVYAQQRARLHPRLEFNVGARLDLQSAFAPRLSPRAAVVWTLPWEGRLKLVVNSAFRSPSGYERFTEFSDQVINPQLRPEAVLTGELSYHQRLGRHRLLVGTFASNFTDMVRLALAPGELGTNGVYWYDNHGAILNLGANARLEGVFGKLSYALNVTGAVNQTDEQLVASPGWFGNARVSWDFGQRLPRLSLAGTLSGSRLISAALATGTDAAGQPLEWDQASRTVGPQAELRATVESALPGVRGLWVRGVVGGSLTPFSAYTVGPRQAPEPGFTTPAQSPNSRLFVLMTVGWALDPAP